MDLPIPTCVAPKKASRCHGRAEMTLQERQTHFRHCRHPECLARLALYDQIAAYVKEHELDQSKK